MRRFTFSSLLAILMFSCFIQAQLSQTNRDAQIVPLRVTLSFDDGSSFRDRPQGLAEVSGKEREGASSGSHGESTSNMGIRVQLLDGFGSLLRESYPNGEGHITFNVRFGGTFRIRVYGADIEENFVEKIDPSEGDMMINIRLHKKTTGQSSSVTTSVSAARLKIPKSAMKEIEKGSHALMDGDLKKAREYFEKSIALYPNNDLAFNNLGVVLMQTGDPEGGQRAFQKAVDVNPSFARAYVNLAKIEINAKRYSNADALLKKAISSDPLNPQTLFLDTEAALYSGNLDDVIANVNRLHMMPHENYALAHYLGADALLKKQMPEAAVVEFELFLKEAPQDPNVPLAQKRLKDLKQSLRSSKDAPKP